MAPVQAAPGSEALAGGALRGAILPVAHAEALLLEEAVHAMLRSTMHRQAATKCSQAYLADAAHFRFANGQCVLACR